MSSHRYFLYARKSTDDASRQARSIDDQIAELRDLARRENLTVFETLIEKQSAKRPGRPVFSAMLDRLARGEADGILAWHPDRLARNALDGGRIIYMLDEQAVRDLKFCNYWFENTAQGKLNLGIQFGMSKYYVDQLSDNIKRGQRQKLKNGIYPSFAPLGYVNDRATRTIVPDPHKAPLVRRAFELYATGEYSIQRIHDEFNAMGFLGRRGLVLGMKNYHELLQNPAYYGLIRFKGELYEGKHEPIVTKALFDRCQAVMASRSKPKNPGLKPFLYRGMFACGECGCVVTSEEKVKQQKNGNVHRYTYCHCSWRVGRCSQRSVHQREISRQVDDALKSVAVPPDWTEWMLGQLHAGQKEDADATAQAVAAIQGEMRDADEKIGRLTEAYVERAMTLPEYKLAKEILVNRKQDLKEKLAATEANRASRFEPVIRFAKSLQEATLRAEGGTEEEKRDLFRKVGSNLSLKDGLITWKPRGAWQTVADHGPFARPNAAPVPGAAGCVGETDQIAQKRRGGDSNSR